MLYLIPTPVGNIEDITVRAKRLFCKLKYIISEDTRVTKKLFNFYEINYSEKEFFSLTSFTNEWRLKHFVNIMKENDVGMVSDAGTPGLSDPGKKMVELCNENEIEFTVLPGANALVPAVVSAGFDTSRFVYLWFLPQKKGRQTILKKIVANFWELPVFFYESVYRVEKTLLQLKDFGFEWKISIAREISKMHEQILTEDIDFVLQMIKTKKIVLKGEFVVGAFVC